MTPFDPRDRARVVKRILVRVARAGDGIADGGVAAHLDKRRTDGRFERRCVSKSQARWRRVIQVFIEQKFIAQERESYLSHKCRRKGVRRLGHKILWPLILPHGKSRNIGALSGKRIGLAALAIAVAEAQRIALGQHMIQLHPELIGIVDERLCADVRERAGIGVRIVR